MAHAGGPSNSCQRQCGPSPCDRVLLVAHLLQPHLSWAVGRGRAGYMLLSIRWEEGSLRQGPSGALPALGSPRRLWCPRMTSPAKPGHMWHKLPLNSASSELSGPECDGPQPLREGSGEKLPPLCIPSLRFPSSGDSGHGSLQCHSAAGPVSAALEKGETQDSGGGLASPLPRGL